jgi:hypothetical protein
LAVVGTVNGTIKDRFKAIASSAVKLKGKTRVVTKRLKRKWKKKWRANHPTAFPLGFTTRQFDRFMRGARQLVQRAQLPKGELVAHGSRITGTARNVSDIDIALRVDEKTFVDAAEKALSRARLGTRLRESMLRRIRQNGQLSSFDLGQEFQALRRELLDANSPVPVQFSILKIGGKLDTGPFLPLGGR